MQDDNSDYLLFRIIIYDYYQALPYKLNEL
jgi:hypothetical protein